MIAADKAGKSKSQQQSPGNKKQEKAGANTAKKAQRKNGAVQAAHQYQAQRDSKKGPWALYMMVVGACVLLVVSYALYMSLTSKQSWTPVPETTESLEVPAAQQPAEQVAPPPSPQPEKSGSNNVAPQVKIFAESIRPNAIVDVPNVSLRNIPDITGKMAAGRIKRGERVEIVKRFASKGPAWVKIRTKSGATGWVFASLLKEMKRR